MVLGAGPFQIPGIRKAVARGHEVVTVDNVPGNPGHRLAHASVHCSTTDAEGVLAAARDLAVDGVCTFSSDVAVPTVAYVSRALGLSGPALAAARTTARKDRFRAFAARAGLAHPRHVAASRPEEAGEALRALSFPVVVKPVDSSGSRGVRRLDAPDPAALQAAFAAAQRHARCGVVCVEELVGGTEVGGDAFVSGGRVAFAVVTEKHLEGFVVRGHRLPGTLAPVDRARVVAEVGRWCEALGYTDGPVNFDVMVSAERVVVLEMSARTGGNGIVALARRTTGVDLEEAVVDLALGTPPALGTDGDRSSGASRPACGSWVFGAPRAGRLHALAARADVLAGVPEIFELFVAYRAGDMVPAFEHNGNLLGYAVFDIPDGSSWAEMAARIDVALALDVVPADAGEPV